MPPRLRLPAVLFIALISTSNLHAQSSSLTVLYHHDVAAGIVMVGNALMRTANNGRTWFKVSPRRSPSEVLAAAYFLDGNTGWGVLSTSSPSGKFTSARVVSTGSSGRFLDGRSSPLPINPQFLQFWSGAAYATFADANHGMVELQQISSSNFRSGIFFSTQNGGRTWAQLPAPPIVDNMRFLSSEVGWIAGGPGGDKLYRTADGGQTWTDDRVPQPARAVATQTFYSVPQINAAGRLFLAVTFVKSTETTDSATLGIYTSNDDGATWEPYSRHSGVSTSSQIITDFTGTSLIAVENSAERDAPNPEGREREAKPLTIIHSPVQAGILSANFVDSFHGWLVVQTGICEKGGSCQEQTKLLATSDGGETTQDITPKKMIGTRRNNPK